MFEDEFLQNDAGAQNKRHKMRTQLRRKWKWSPWRIVPLPLSAYIVTGAYLWLIGTPDAWQRAIGPVLTVGTFVVVGPTIQHWWLTRERAKFMRARIEPEHKQTQMDL